MVEHRSEQKDVESQKEIAKKMAIDALVELNRNYNDVVPTNREQPADKPSKLSATFFFGVQTILLQIVRKKIISKQKCELLLHSVHRIGELLAAREKIQFIDKPDDHLDKAPEHLREAFRKARSQALIDLPGAAESEIVNRSLTLMDEDLRQEFLIFVALGQGDSRVPIEGEVPEDIRVMVESQIKEIKQIINLTLGLLGAYDKIEA